MVHFPVRIHTTIIVALTLALIQTLDLKVDSTPTWEVQRPDILDLRAKGHSFLAILDGSGLGSVLAYQEARNAAQARIRQLNDS